MRRTLETFRNALVIGGSPLASDSPVALSSRIKTHEVRFSSEEDLADQARTLAAMEEFSREMSATYAYLLREHFGLSEREICRKLDIRRGTLRDRLKNHNVVSRGEMILRSLDAHKLLPSAQQP